MVNLAQDLKPVSYIQDHTMEILNYVENSRSPIVITHDGEAKAVIIDINSYQKTLNAINTHEDAKKKFEKMLARRE